MTVAEKCLALPEMVDKILSFLGKNDLINCLCINTEWHQLGLRHVLRDVVVVTTYNFDLLSRTVGQGALA